VHSTTSLVHVRIVSCTSPGHPLSDSLHQLHEALTTTLVVRTTILTEEGASASGFPEADHVMVSCGTKFSKLRALIPLDTHQVVCICDPDMSLDINACVELVTDAVVALVRDKPSVVFAVIETQAESSFLDHLVSFDKWLSHRILRPVLWRLGLGITLPGQFLIVPASLMNAIPDEIDTFLDDICLGLLVRELGLGVIRSSVVVGREAGRRSGLGLVFQRLRWMKGLMALKGHYWRRPTWILRLVTQYLAYHGIPIATLFVLTFGLAYYPILSVSCYCLGVIMMACVSRRSLVTVAAYWIAFPILHLVVSLSFWLPFPDDILRKR
jgi:hypothetical protein